MAEYTPTPEEEEVLKIINAEKTDWEEGAVFVTDNTQFIMSNVIKKARKNYYGVFDNPKDPQTGRQKIFIPLTEWTCETMSKNIDIDVKDFSVIATSPDAYLKALVFRMLLHKKLKEINFGNTLNKWLKRVVIDGTGFLRAYADDKGRLKIDVVDRNNMIVDPSVEELEQSGGIIERSILSKPEFDNLGLENSDLVVGTNTVDRTSASMVGSGQVISQIPFVEVFTRIGYLPLFVKTGKEEDRNKYFYAKAIISGLNGRPVVHTVEELDEPIPPYCMGRLKEVPNRLDGRGVGEMLFNIQAYTNEVVNSRLNKSRIVNLGLFQMKGNVTPQQFKNLFTTGGIKLDENSSVSPIDTGIVSNSSYNDENQAYTWATRVTGTTNEDNMASNRPATNALIEEQGAGKGYNMRIEGLTLALGEFMKNVVVPIIKKELLAEKGKIKRITGDPEILEKLRVEFTRNAMSKFFTENPDKLRKLQEEGKDFEGAVKEKAEEVKKEMNNELFIPIVEELMNVEYDVELVINDESINKAAMAKMLQDTLGLLAQSGLPIRNTLRELYDTIGLNGENLIQDMPQQTPQAPGQQPGEETGAGSPAQQISQMMPK